MQDDLKNWQAHSGFELFTPDEVVKILSALLAVAFLFDLLGVWAR